MKISLPDADIQLLSHFVTPNEADRWQTELEQTLNWQQHRIKIYGREINCPRLSAWHGDADAQYAYSGQTLVPEPWTDRLQALRELVEHAANTSMNSVLANWYRNGEDSMGWHSDDEPELGEKPTILSLSFGEPRVFQLKHKTSGQREKILLPSGSLLVMSGDTQDCWQHAINKSKRAMRGRLNLTFRNIFPKTHSAQHQLLSNDSAIDVT